MVTAAGPQSTEETRRRFPVSQVSGMCRPVWPRARTPPTPCRPPQPQGIRLLLEQKKRQVPGLREPIKEPIKNEEGLLGRLLPGARGPALPPWRRNRALCRSKGHEPHYAVCWSCPSNLLSACTSFFLKLLFLELFLIM